MEYKMNYLADIQKRNIGTEVNSVNARELHEMIDVKRVFASWITARIKKFKFIENQDFIIVKSKRDGNNVTVKDYYLTLNMARELSMVENNEKGREARRYFIQVEEKARALLVSVEKLNATKRGYLSQLAQKDKLIEQLKEEQKLLPAPTPKGRVMGRFEMGAVLDVMSSGEQLLESAEKLRVMFDRLYAGAGVYDVRKGM